MRKRNKAISRTLMLIVVIAVVAIAAVSLYIMTSPPSPSTTTQPSTQTTPSTTTSTTTLTTPTTTSPSPTTTSTLTSPTTTSTSSTTTTTTTSTTTSTTTTTPQGFQVYNMTSVKDLVTFSKHIKFKFEVFNKTESEQYVSTFTFDDKGYETVNGKEARKIEFSIEDDGEVSTFVFWYLKEDWTVVVKAVINGEEVPESYLPYVSLYARNIFYPFLFVYTGTLSPLLLEPIPPEFGVIQLVSVRDITYGQTTLNVQEYRFTPNPVYKPLQDFTGISLLLAKIDQYMLLTGYRIDFKDGSYYSYELIELTRP